MNELAVMIMAAGQGKRFGGCKQLAILDGKSLLQRSIDTATTIAGDHVYVVAGAYHDDIAAEVKGARLIHNRDWADGLGGSIACGVNALAEEFRGILIMLADQVALTKQDLVSLQTVYDGNNIVCAQYCGQRGVPALFSHHYFTELRQLSGDKGAKTLLNSTALPVVAVDIANAAVDIDLLKELEELRK